MISLFDQYEILERSGLFDIAYYRTANPDVASASIDPLLHYLEHGARAGLNPSDRFDTAFYLEQCRRLGEAPENPLLHFVTRGAARGLKTRRDERALEAPSPAGEFATVSPLDRITLDMLTVMPGDGGQTGLKGAGWLIASEPVVEIVLEFQGETLGYATYGIGRPDVAAQHPTHPNADQSGFVFAIDSLPAGLPATAELSVAVRLLSGRRVRHPFQVELADAVRRAGAAAQGSSGVRRSGGTSTLPLPPMRLQTDDVAIDEQGVLTIDGWIVSLAPLIAVEVFLDDEPLGPAEFGKRRDDVAEVYRDYLNPAFSGFRFVTDLRPFGEGKRTLKIQGTAKGGIKRDLQMPLTLEAPAKPRPPIDQSTVRLECDEFHLTSDGRLTVEGWAVCAAGIEAIVILLDGVEVGTAQLGIDRPDVGNTFPEIPAARRAGFAFREIVAKDGIAGEHLLSIRVRTSEGDAGDMQLPVAAIEVDGAATTPDGGGAAEGQDELKISIDLPQLVGGAVVTPVRGNLEIAGWALARKGTAAIDIAINGEVLVSAFTGIRRLDVQDAFSDWDGALTSGFSAVLPHRMLPRGRQVVTVTLHDQHGRTARSEFRIEVEEAPETAGPWSLRRRMTQAEADLHHQIFVNVSERPCFRILLPLARGAAGLREARITLASLGEQVYEDWCLVVLSDSQTRDALRDALLEGFESLAERVDISPSDLSWRGLAAPRGTATYFMGLRPGDELGCDALLEFAVHAVLHKAADLLYADERRINTSSGKIEAFFKPDWSPDLLLATNYLGRSWCARADLARRTVSQPGGLARTGSYELALRLTEQATSIQHIGAVLLQAATGVVEKETVQQAALESALVRRGIDATIEPGRAAGSFRVRRRVATRGLVSIIIPTCAARGLIKTCLDTLRGLTAYRNFEIVCIENIPEERLEWKTWLRDNADTVISTTEPFNWSRFNNLAVAQSKGEYLLFLNDDIEIIAPDWLDALLEHAERPEIGVVGPQLLYPDGRVQHAGMFLAGMGVARHAFRYAAGDDPGYFGLALTQRNVIAVTGACFMTRRETFTALGGFDESHNVVNNDLDYCLRIWRCGLRTVYTPHATLIHHELASRTEIGDEYDSAAFDSQWRNLFVGGDPFFHQRLAKNRDDYSCEWEPTQLHCSGHPVFARDRIRRLLIVKLDHIGDCVTALPAVRRLKRHFPLARLYVLTSRASKPVWALEPVVDELIEFDFFHARSSSGLVERTEEDWRQLRERLAPYHFDLALDLRKHVETRPVLQQTGARYLAGFDYRGAFPWLDLAVEWAADQAHFPKRHHTADELIGLVDAIAAACEADRTVIAEKPKLLAPDVLAAVPNSSQLFKKRVVCVHPAAGTEMRQWPPEYFALLIDQLIESEDVHVALIGGPDEAPLADRILAEIVHTSSAWSLAGRTKLGDLPSVLAACALFIGNNSGPHHIAAALGVPTIGIHSGVTDAREWGPLGPAAVAMNRDMSCAPCYSSKMEECHRGFACLRQLLPGDVFRMCRRLLAVSARPKAAVRASGNKKDRARSTSNVM